MSKRRNDTNHAMVRLGLNRYRLGKKKRPGAATPAGAKVILTLVNIPEKSECDKMKERVKKKIAKNKRREVLELLDLAMRKNEGKASVFFDFCGHVNLVSVRIHKNGWSHGETHAMGKYLDANYSSDTPLPLMKKELEAL